MVVAFFDEPKLAVERIRSSFGPAGQGTRAECADLRFSISNVNRGGLTFYRLFITSRYDCLLSHSKNGPKPKHKIIKSTSKEKKKGRKCQIITVNLIFKSISKSAANQSIIDCGFLMQNQIMVPKPVSSSIIFKLKLKYEIENIYNYNWHWSIHFTRFVMIVDYLPIL